MQLLLRVQALLQTWPRVDVGINYTFFIVVQLCATLYRGLEWFLGLDCWWFVWWFIELGLRQDLHLILLKLRRKCLGLLNRVVLVIKVRCLDLLHPHLLLWWLPTRSRRFNSNTWHRRQILLMSEAHPLWICSATLNTSTHSFFNQL